MNRQDRVKVEAEEVARRRHACGTWGESEEEEREFMKGDWKLAEMYVEIDEWKQRECRDRVMKG